MPNGYVASVIRKQSIGEIDIPPQLRHLFNDEAAVSIGASHGASLGLFEAALMNQFTDQITNVEGFMAPVDVARKLREWFELPPARPFRDASED